MNDESRTREQLIEKLAELRQRNAEMAAGNGLAAKLFQQTEEALRESEEKYKHIAENRVVGIAMMQDGRIMYVNDTCARIFGCEKSEFIGKNFQDLAAALVVPEHRSLIDERVEKELDNRDLPMSYVVDGLKADGTKILLEISSSGAFTYKDKPTIVAVIRDVTEQKQAEAALQASEERYRLISKRSSTYCYSLRISPEGTILVDWIGGEFTDITGYNRKIISDLEKWYAVIHPDDLPLIQQGAERVFSGEPGTIEYRLRTKDGREIWLEDYSAPVLDENKQQVTGIIGTVRDITEQKQAEEALRESEEKYRTYIENAPNGVFVVDSNSRYIDANQAACLMTGYSREELLNMSIPELASPASPSETFELFNELKETGLVHGEVILRRKDGTDFHSSIEAVSLTDDNFMAFCSDITNHKRMEEELLKVEKLESVGVLAGGIAHDLNNLLTGVIGNISLARIYEDPVKKDGSLAEAEKASMRIKDLTHQLLTFARGGAPILQTADIELLLKDSATFALRGSNVGCEFSIPDDLWPVEIDVGQINQIINNLIINARQAMPDGGTIKIRAENVNMDRESGLPLKIGSYTKVSIQDEGTGISQKHIQKIFDPFFTTKQEGNGLGLATSYSIIHKHNGHITVESELGAGATFHIYLPASPEGILVEWEEETAGPIMGTGRILVMDDEELVREIVSNMLTEMGYEVTTAIDGTQAIEMYKEAMGSGNPYDAAIIDLTVPGGMGGKETIQRLTEIDPEIKAIVSSGYSNDPIMAKFGEYGFRDFIVKPYKTRELSVIMHRVITDSNLK